MKKGGVGVDHRKIRLIEGNAKCRHLKKVPCKGTLWQVFICMRPGPPRLTRCLHVYSILIHTGTGGGEPERRGEGQQLTKLGRKYQHD
jgi:hypothetical protein